MQAIEFEATPIEHTIRIPDYVPDGVAVRVLLLVDDNIINQKDTGNNTRKNLIESMPDVGRDEDFARENIMKCQAALAHIATIKVDWQSKPIADRDALYDEARD